MQHDPGTRPHPQPLTCVVPFRRQRPLGRFVLDFYCPVWRLAVELDGSSHDGQGEQPGVGASSSRLHVRGEGPGGSPILQAPRRVRLRTRCFVSETEVQA